MILVIFAFTALLFIAKLFFIQVLNDDWKKKGARITESARIIYPARGIVYDRNEKIIVDNIAAFDLMVLPKQVTQFDTVKLAMLTDLTVDEVKERLTKARNYSRYKASEFLTQINGKDFVRIKENLSEFPGFFSRDRTLRTYPHSAAPHLFGYIGEVSPRLIDEDTYYRSGDYIGTSGIEKSYEKQLRGQRGVEYVLVDVFNNVKGKYNSGDYDTVSVNGLDLYSTIDIDLQSYGEKLMQNKRGSIVAIDPETGEVLCMVNNPSYDPNLLVGRVRSENYKKLRNDTLKPLFNRSMQAQYPPGSTFKLIQALIGLQDGTLRLDTYYSCHGGYFFGRRKLGCHVHRSPVGLNYSISTSCNAYYCNVFKDYLDSHSTTEEGYLKWTNYVSKFGIGSKLGIDLPSEMEGMLKEPGYFDKFYGKGVWKPHTIISMAIGQGELLVTPLQMANYASVIANRGHYITPHIVKGIGEKENTPQIFERKETGIRTEHFETVIDGMYSVIEEGTGRGVRFSPEIEVCGKTGTAQNPFGKDHSIFISFAPKDDPKIAVAVYVENVGFGSTWAAPINSLILEKYLTGTTTRPRIEKKMVEADLLHN